MQTGIELIAAERERQITKEGWSPEHDDEHTCNELADAAIAYALASMGVDREMAENHFWPWDFKFWKPSEDPIRNLVKAGALIAAEIDRLQRKPESCGWKSAPTTCS